MFVAILFVLLIGAFIFSAVMYQRSKKLKGSKRGSLHGGSKHERLSSKRSEGPKSVRNLKVNDIVSYMGQDFIVEGKLVFDEDGDKWYEYMLVDGSDVRWLSVEEDDMLELGLYQVVKDLPLMQNPREFLEYNGVRFRLEEHGAARMRREGRTAGRTATNCRYWDYQAGDGEILLSVEQWGQSYEVSLGRKIDEAAVDILPGDLIDE